MEAYVSILQLPPNKAPTLDGVRAGFRNRTLELQASLKDKKGGGNVDASREELKAVQEAYEVLCSILETEEEVCVSFRCGDSYCFTSTC
jgi:hypothetical protein